MTTELPQAPAESGPVAASAAFSDKSQSHRRRRRRRKNKPAQPGAPQAQPAQGAAFQPAPATPPPAAPPKSKAAAQPKQPRKKKFFQKNAQPGNAQPGNGSTSQQQPKMRKSRQQQQRTPRQFVGPMDHSYRTSNGNIADGPPSTIQITNGNMQADHFAEAYTPAVPVREDAATRIYCFIEDLFFTAKINEAARKLGIKVEFIKGAAKEEIARLLDLPEEARPKLLVYDLNNANAKPLTVIPKFKSKFKRATSIIGFLNHLQGELKGKAVEAGCDTVMPRSAFSQSLPNLLRRYGLDDDEDYGPQPV